MPLQSVCSLVAGGDSISSDWDRAGSSDYVCTLVRANFTAAAKPAACLFGESVRTTIPVPLNLVLVPNPTAMSTSTTAPAAGLCCVTTNTPRLLMSRVIPSACSSIPFRVRHEKFARAAMTNRGDLVFLTLISRRLLTVILEQYG